MTSLHVCLYLITFQIPLMRMVLKGVARYKCKLNKYKHEHEHEHKCIMVFGKIVTFGKAVDHFKYLGSVLTRDGHCTGEIRTILNNIRRRKANWIDHILRRNCLLHDPLKDR